MPLRHLLPVIETDTEPVRQEHNLVELMRVAVDGSGSFLSRRAAQILREKFNIAVIGSFGILTAKAPHLATLLGLISKGVV